MAGTVFRVVYLLLAGLAMVWAFAAISHTDELARAGYSVSQGRRVVHVVPGSPADRAGLRVGDTIVRIDGVETRDRAAVTRLSGGAIGALRRLDIVRGEAPQSVEVELEGLNARERWRRYAAICAGVCFILSTGLAWLRRPIPAGAALATMGLGFGLAFLGPADWLAETSHVALAVARNALILAGVGAGLHFLRLMVVPRRSRRWPATALYAPLAAYWLLLTVRTLNPEGTPHLVSSFISVAGGLLFALYLTLAIVTLARAWVRNRQAGIRDPVLGSLCAGSALGLLPVAVAALVPVLWPGLTLPGGDFWFLAILLVPLGFSAGFVTYKD